jgi:hypothetical protein
MEIARTALGQKLEIPLRPPYKPLVEIMKIK